MRRTELFLAISKFFTNEGIPFEFKESGKHNKVVYYVNGQKRTCTFSKSSCNRHAVLNCLGDIKRSIRELTA